MELVYTHDDVITSVTQSTKIPTRFITTSLDGMVKLYDLKTNQIIQEIDTKIPILDSVFVQHTNQFYISCVDGTVRLIDFEMSRASDEPVGFVHEKGVNCLLYLNDSETTLVSGSWDGKLQLIKLGRHNNNQCPGPGQNQCQSQSQVIELPGKVLAMDYYEDKLVVAMTNRLIHVYDLNNMSLLQSMESGLKYQIRSVSCFAKGFAASSIEGKVSVDYYDQDQHQTSYAFRCHRKGDLVNSVNCVLVAKQNNNHLLYTAGDDGNVIEWNHNTKKKLQSYSIRGRSEEGKKISKFILMNDDKTLVVISENEVYMKSIK